MVFVELSPFVAFRAEHWSDDDLRELQSFLLVRPDAGDLTREQVKVLANLMKDIVDG